MKALREKHGAFFPALTKVVSSFDAELFESVLSGSRHSCPSATDTDANWQFVTVTVNK